MMSMARLMAVGQAALAPVPAIIGTIVYNATTLAPAYPAGIEPGDQLACVVGQKPTTANGGTAAALSGWIKYSNLAKGGYGTTTGADVGNTNLFMYTKIADGTETGSLSISLTDTNIAWAVIVVLKNRRTQFSEVTHVAGEDTTAGSMSVVFSTSTAAKVGDIILCAMCIPTDVTTPSQFSAPSVAGNAATFTSAELGEPDSGTGNDIGGLIFYGKVSDVTSSPQSSITVSATAGGTTTNVRGPVSILKVLR